MRAARYHGHKDIRIEDNVPEPQCAPGRVKLAPQFVGICGSDIHIYFHDSIALRPGVVHPVSKQQLPIVFGHEFSGVVTEVGADVDRVKVGDRVAVQPSLYDGTCSACTKGYINCCKDWGFLGIQGDGGLSEAVVVDERAVFKLPDNVESDVGAMVEPLAVAWHAVRSGGQLDASSTVLVLGSGPIGCAVYLALVAKGVKNIVVSEPGMTRQSYVKALGAEYVFNPLETDVVAEVNRLSNDDGAAAVFDCAGVPASLQTAVAALQVRGTIVNIALWDGPAPVNLNAMVVKEGTIKSVLGYVAEDFDQVIAAMESGSLKPESMISRKIALGDLVEKGLVELAERSGEHCKIMIDLSLPWK